MRGYSEASLFSEGEVMYHVCDKCGNKFYIDGEIDVFVFRIVSLSDYFEYKLDRLLDIDLCEHCTIMILDSLREIGITCGETK